MRGSEACLSAKTSAANEQESSTLDPWWLDLLAKHESTPRHTSHAITRAPYPHPTPHAVTRVTSCPYRYLGDYLHRVEEAAATVSFAIALGILFDPQIARIEAVCLLTVDGRDAREVECLDVPEHARHHEAVVFGLLLAWVAMHRERSQLGQVDKALCGVELANAVCVEVYDVEVGIACQHGRHFLKLIEGQVYPRQVAWLVDYFAEFKHQVRARNNIDFLHIPFDVSLSSLLIISHLPLLPTLSLPLCFFRPAQCSQLLHACAVPRRKSSASSEVAPNDDVESRRERRQEIVAHLERLCPHAVVGRFYPIILLHKAAHAFDQGNGQGSGQVLVKQQLSASISSRRPPHLDGVCDLLAGLVFEKIRRLFAKT